VTSVTAHWAAYPQTGLVITVCSVVSDFEQLGTNNTKLIWASFCEENYFYFSRVEDQFPTPLTGVRYNTRYRIVLHCFDNLINC